MKDSYLFYKNKLNNEYKTAFEQVELYVFTKNVDESTREERLSDLLDIFLSAQETGKPVEKITGTNMERFCKTFCSDLGMKNRILNILDVLKYVAWVLLVFSVLDVLAVAGEADINIWQIMSTNVSVYIIGLIPVGILTAFTNSVFCHIMFKVKRVSMCTLTVFTVIETCVAFAGLFLISNIVDGYIYNPPLWTVLLFSCLYLVVYYLLLGKRQKRPNVKLSDVTQESVLTEMEPVMMERFKKERTKQLHHGKDEMSFEQFLDREEKICRRAEKTKYFYYILPIIVTGIFYTINCIIYGFEGMLDLILFVVLTLTLQYFIMFVFLKTEKYGVRERRAWVAKKRDELKK